MNQTEKNSKSKVVLIVVGAVAVVAIVGGLAYAFMSGTTKKTATTSEATTNSRPEVTADSLRQGLQKLNATVEQEKTDRANAQATYNDSSKRIKLSN
jgi:flagellar basal body-associated protein FliL